ncbi:hypothetical protein ACFLWH_01455 [Chloroflexota bacterium]
MPNWLKGNASNGFNQEMKKGQLHYRWIILAACLAIGIMTWGTRLSFSVFFESLEKEFGWTRAITSGIFSVSMLVACVFAVFGGRALDRYGGKITFTVMACPPKTGPELILLEKELLEHQSVDKICVIQREKP